MSLHLCHFVYVMSLPLKMSIILLPHYLPRALSSKLRNCNLFELCVFLSVVVLFAIMLSARNCAMLRYSTKHIILHFITLGNMRNFLCGRGGTFKRDTGSPCVECQSRPETVRDHIFLFSLFLLVPIVRPLLPWLPVKL